MRALAGLGRQVRRAREKAERGQYHQEEASCHKRTDPLRPACLLVANYNEVGCCGSDTVRLQQALRVQG
jgi:hypothetical protein